MSQIRITSLAFGLLPTLFVFALSGCGDRNTQANFDPVTGKHIEATWKLNHKDSADTDAKREPCKECHGEAFTGGNSKVDCTTQCHLGGVESIHPVVWGALIDAQHGNYATANGTQKCSNASCHGSNLTGVTGSGVSCTSCHIGDATHKHPAVGWNKADFSIYASHPAYVAANSDAKCANAACHGADLLGNTGTNPGATGPSCSSCHLGGKSSVHPATTNNWISDHQGYVLSGKNLAQTKAKCDVAVCHGSDRQTGGNIKTVKSAPACQACHLGEKF